MLNYYTYLFVSVMLKMNIYSISTFFNDDICRYMFSTSILENLCFMSELSSLNPGGWKSRLAHGCLPSGQGLQ